MKCNIVPMTISHFLLIEPILTSKYDDFWTPSILKQELENPNSHYFVSLIPTTQSMDFNIIGGFAGIWKAFDEYHIMNIAVRKDLRCQGIGSQLLEKLIETAQSDNVNSLTLEVNAKNEPAQKLYKKYGFQILGVRKKYYNKTDDAIIMTLYFHNKENL